jgi:hypothetical protein
VGFTSLEEAALEGKWGPEILERIKAHITSEKRYMVKMKEERGDN